jgi:nucleoside-diphosphate-sugar epimerase
MQVFVSGASGALGRAAVPALVARGHTVLGLATSPTSAVRVRSLGATPIAADLFAPKSLARAVAGCDAVLHLASHIPAPPAAQEIDAWRENDRIRRIGTHHLVDAALSAGAAVFVYPSAVFVYPDSGDRWIDADTPPDPPPVLASDLDAEREVARFGAGGGRGVVLRLGRLYGRDNPATAALIRAARDGLALIVGRDNAYESWLSANDAATAFRLAIEHVPTGVYDLVDDEPLRRAEEARVLARAVGRRTLTRPPAGAPGRPLGALDEALSRSLRVSNRRFRDASGWRPVYPSLRDGLAMILAGNADAESGAQPAEV